MYIYVYIYIERAAATTVTTSFCLEASPASSDGSTQATTFMTREQWATVGTLVLPILYTYKPEDVLEQVLALLHHATTETRPSHGIPDLTLRIVVVTSGSDGPPKENAQVGPMGSGAVWGLMRTAHMELPSRVSVMCMDTDASKAEDLTGQIVSELRIPDTDGGFREVAYRGCTRHCRRLQRSRFHTIGPAALQLEERGHLTDLDVVPLDNQPVFATRHGFVEVHVCAVGLNFKDQ